MLVRREGLGEKQQGSEVRALEKTFIHLLIFILVNIYRSRIRLGYIGLFHCKLHSFTSFTRYFIS